MILSGATVFLGGGLILMTTIVLVRYLIEWRRTPGRKGLIPLHVWLVAVSYDLLVVLVLINGIGSGGVALDDWRAWIRIPALLMGLAAMFVLANFQHRSYAHEQREV